MNVTMTKTRRLTEGAIMVALATILSLIKFDLPTGGGVTLCAMLPIVFMAYRHGTKWGVFTAFVFSVLQLFLGLDNVHYASSAMMAIGIVLFDYIIAYTVIGFAGIFKGKFKNARIDIVAGTITTLFARFLCHFITGWFIWDRLYPNEMGLTAPIYSFVYNGSYMLVEIIITSIVAALIVKWANYGMDK
ncbi:MAG: energy-coupled thiamine transporter ThiT [Oscillospiraceae bacterium]